MPPSTQIDGLKIKCDSHEEKGVIFGVRENYFHNFLYNFCVKKRESIIMYYNKFELNYSCQIY